MKNVVQDLTSAGEDCFPKYIKQFLNHYYDTNPDIVIYNHNSYDGKNKAIAFKDIFTTGQDCVVEKEAVLKEYLSRHSIVSVCGKMVKRTCIDVNRDYANFGRISTGEDAENEIEA